MDIYNLEDLEDELRLAELRIQTLNKANDKHGLIEELEYITLLKNKLHKLLHKDGAALKPTNSRKSASASSLDSVASCQSNGMNTGDSPRTTSASTVVSRQSVFHSRAALPTGNQTKEPSFFNPKFGFCWIPDFLVVDLLATSIPHELDLVLAYALLENNELKTPIMQTPRAHAQMTYKSNLVLAFDLLRIFKHKVSLSPSTKLLVELRGQPNMPVETEPHTTIALGWCVIPVFSLEGNVLAGKFRASLCEPPINLNKAYVDHKATLQFFFRLQAVQKVLDDQSIAVADFLNDGPSYVFQNSGN